MFRCTAAANVFTLQTNVQLRQLANQYQYTLPQLLIALIAIYLHRVTGQNDLVIGLPYDRADESNPARFSGRMASSRLLPLRLNIDAEHTIGGLSEAGETSCHGRCTASKLSRGESEY
ncbi:condensation domain-containing protein [Vibrio sp. PP-XX7]